MEGKILIKRNGSEFYRKKREVIYEKNVNFRYSEENIKKLKEIAEDMKIGYQTLIKNILNEYLEEKYGKRN